MGFMLPRWARPREKVGGCFTILFCFYFYFSLFYFFYIDIDTPLYI
jgi:hypothetical protein